MLAQSKYTFKLTYDEKVFGIQWTNLDDEEANMKGVMATNQRICIVDSCLSGLVSLNLENNIFVTSLMWFGQTVLYSTERHLMYLTQDKSENGSGIVMSFNCFKGA